MMFFNASFVVLFSSTLVGHSVIVNPRRATEETFKWHSDLLRVNGLLLFHDRLNVRVLRTSRIQLGRSQRYRLARTWLLFLIRVLENCKHIKCGDEPAKPGIISWMPTSTSR